MNLPAYFTGFSSRSDGSASLRFTTQELAAEDFALLYSLHNQFGWLLFSPNQIQDEEIPDDAEENKKPSKRLRASLYVLWSQEGKHGEFESFYRERMEKVIEFVKAKLDS